MHFSQILGLGASIADFGSEGHVFESWSHHFFFIGSVIEIRTHGPQIQSKLCLPFTKGTDLLGQKDFVSNSTCWEMRPPPPWEISSKITHGDSG